MTDVPGLTVPLTPDDAERGLKLAVHERGGDFRYQDRYGTGGELVNMCAYEVEGEPACIVGLALHKLGWPVRELVEIDCADEGGGIADLIAAEHVFIADGGARRVVIAMLSDAQTTQDTGATWEEALQAALAARAMLEVEHRELVP